MPISSHAEKILELFHELELYVLSKEQFLTNLQHIEEQYQHGQFDYLRYEHRIEQVLQGKSKEAWLAYYNSYIFSLLRNIGYYNEQLFLEAYKIQVDVPLRMRGEELPVPIPKKRSWLAIFTRSKKAAKPEKKPLAPPPAAPRPTAILEGGEEEEVVIGSEIPEGALTAEDTLAAPETVRTYTAKNMPPEHPVEAPGRAIAQRAKPKQETPRAARKLSLLQRMFAAIRKFFRGSEAPLFDQILEEKEKKEISGVATIGSLLGLGSLRDFIMALTYKPSRQTKEQLVHNDLRLRYIRTGNFSDLGKTEHINATLLRKEAERVQQLLQHKRALQLYKPSLVGAVANLAVRDLSFWLIDRFPGFFRSLYNNIRYANLKILSNTYVNIMVLITLFTGAFSLLIFPLLFLFQGETLLAILLKTVFMTVILSAVSFFSFYLYPLMRARDRRANIQANMPFALNHMAAVAASGVPPNIMFKLVDQTEEYGEICLEAKKIDQFITIFGYDMITAIRSIASTTPRPSFKEFLEGMASTVESGGDLQDYLEEKSKESLLTYELERQKYTEAIQTYSDIYTGILIAAPLFFVAALSLISILGGGLGGMPIDVLLSLSTYLVIPLLNVLFIIFLELNQPEL